MSASLVLPERVVFGDAAALLAALQTAAPAAPIVQIDAGALQTFDSSVVAVLLALQRQLVARGQSLQLCQRSDRLQALLTLYGVADLLPA